MCIITCTSFIMYLHVPCMHTLHVHVPTCICTCACMYVCMYNICMYVIHVCMHVCMYVCINVCIYAGPLRGGRWGYFSRAWTNRGPGVLVNVNVAVICLCTALL